MIRRFELTGDFGIAPGEADGQLRQKLAVGLFQSSSQIASQFEPQNHVLQPQYGTRTSPYSRASILAKSSSTIAVLKKKSVTSKESPANHVQTHVECLQL